MLHILTQAHTTCVWTHFQAVFGCHQQHRQNLIDPAHAASVDLHHINGFAHDELFEHDAVLAHFTRCHLDGLDCFTDGAVRLHIVRTGWLFNKPRFGERQFLHPSNRFVAFPNLVGINHQIAIRADDVAGDLHTALVFFQIATDFELDVIKAFVHRFLAQTRQFFFAVTQPTCRCGVTRIALRQQILQTRGLAFGLLGEQLQGFFRGDAVG